MKIGVMSDTHDRLRARLEKLARVLGDADEIWHLGDVCEPSVLEDVLALGPPLMVVRGNCDWEDSWPLTADRTLHGVRFHLVHIPPATAPSGVDVLLHGHTHIPRDETIGGVRFLNPGTVGKPKTHPVSCAVMELGRDGSLSWKLVLL
jgi:putative phosphoesterase